MIAILLLAAVLSIVCAIFAFLFSFASATFDERETEILWRSAVICLVVGVLCFYGTFQSSVYTCKILDHKTEEVCIAHILRGETLGETLNDHK